MWQHILVLFFTDRRMLYPDCLAGQVADIEEPGGAL
jgi:hypothetical protein